jgi:hypothetical protein
MRLIGYPHVSGRSFLMKIQKVCHPSEGWDPIFLEIHRKKRTHWIPAFPGMTNSLIA